MIDRDVEREWLPDMKGAETEDIIPRGTTLRNV